MKEVLLCDGVATKEIKGKGERKMLKGKKIKSLEEIKFKEIEMQHPIDELELECAGILRKYAAIIDPYVRTLIVKEMRLAFAKHQAKELRELRDVMMGEDEGGTGEHESGRNS